MIYDNPAARRLQDDGGYEADLWTLPLHGGSRVDSTP